VVEIRGLRFAFPGAGHDVIAIDKLDVASGESLFLFGPSGSGKSTLLGLLAGVLVPREGHVRLHGTDWGALRTAERDAYRARHVGYIFQQFNLLPYLDAIDNVLLPCRFSRTRRERAVAQSGSASAAARTLLERVGLVPPLWTRPAARLSVGQQQRVAAARALIGHPEVVIADEPTSALDAPLRDAFMGLLLGQCKSAQSTLIFVSHDDRLAAHFDRAVALPDVNRAGRLEDLGG